MQDILFHETEILSTLQVGNQCRQNITLIIRNATIWTGRDEVPPLGVWPLRGSLSDSSDLFLCGCSQYRDALIGNCIVFYALAHICMLTSTSSCTAKPMLQVAFAEAMAVLSSGNIIAVGSSAEVLLLQQPATQVKDLQGAFVMPASPSHTATLLVTAVLFHMTS